MRETIVVDIELVQSTFRYEPETGSLFWIVAGGPKRPPGHRADVKDGDYRGVRWNGKLLAAHRIAWVCFHGYWPPVHIDHINGDHSDNRISNLRPANDIQNLANCRKYSNNKSGIKGVWWDSTRGKWAAQLKYAGKKYHVGRFDNKQVAEAAYQKLAIELRGEYAFGVN